MPARDLYHDAARNALVKDGWTITHDPLKVPWGRRDLFVDLGAEKLIAAEKAGRKIAVEVKSFLGTSLINDLEKAIGQFVLYRSLLFREEPERVLYLAIPEPTLKDLYAEQLAELLLEDQLAKIIAFDPQKEVIVRWTP